MKSIIKYSALCIVLLFITNTLFAQTYEEYKKAENEKLKKFELQQKEELARMAKEFDAFVSKADQEFVNYLQEEWANFQAFQGIKVPERPKPVQIPEFKKSTINISIPTEEIPIILPKKEAEIIAKEEPILPIIQKSEPDDFLTTKVEISYYGTKLSFEYDDNIAKSILNDINKKSIGNWWSVCSKSNYNILINQFLKTKNILSLNDWAYFMLIQKTAEQIANGDKNNTRLLSWFFMIRSGYKAKVAFSNNDVYLLLPSENELYEKSYLLINNEHYYFTEKINTRSFQTYEFDFPNAHKSIDYNIYQPLNIGNDTYEKIVSFTYNETEYSFPVVINSNSLYLLKDYPITELGVFFNAAMSRVTKQSLIEGLMPLINNMPVNEAINFLLGFVQKSFTYQTDQEQFNKEKFFFPEELFFYAASDCEDRSALFSYIVKQLLDLKVIGLAYKGHVSTAIHVNQDIQGDYFFFDNKKYVIADPTYINAPMGLSMPKYKNLEARVIRIDNRNYRNNNIQKYWELTNAMGGFRGSNLNDTKFDSQGNCYQTGYYIQNVNFDKYIWNSDTDSRKAFIVKFNSDNEVLWAKNILAKGDVTAFTLTLDDQENPVIAGSFSGEINAEKYSLKTSDNKHDVFIAAYDPNGKLKWINKSGLDALNPERFLNYVVEINKNGRDLNTKLYFDSELKTSNGIYFADNTLKMIGGINNTTGFMSGEISYDADADFNTIDYLKIATDSLVKNDVNESIAGLFAAINLIQASGMTIPGEEAQKALDKHNPEFKNTSPNIYENIGKVNFMKNENGIILVKTTSKTVLFDKIKISNGAKIKITPLKDRDAKIDILSGIKVGKLFIWFDLNYIEMLHTNGNMLFDYDDDHTQVTVNMKEDILY